MWLIAVIVSSSIGVSPNKRTIQPNRPFSQQAFWHEIVALH